MSLFIRELLYLDEVQGNIVTAKMSFGTLIDVLRSVLLNEFGAQHTYFKRFEKTQKELSQREQQRNQIVHSIWSFGSTLKADSATRIKVVRNKSQGTRREFIQVTLNELKEIADSMEHLEWEVSDLRVRICHYEASVRPKRAFIT
jgi:hypothetical protein